MHRKVFLNRKNNRASVWMAAAFGFALLVSHQMPVLAAGTGPVSGLDGITEEAIMPDQDLEEISAGAASPLDGIVSAFDGIEVLGRRAKLVNKSIPLYLAQKNPVAETVCYFNAAGNYEIKQDSLLPIQVNKIPFAPKLSIESILYNGLPALKITASGNAATVQKGTYTYKLVPYDKGRQEELSAVTLKVSVKAMATYPSMKVNASTVTLNSQVKGDYAYVYALTEGARIQPLDHAETPAKIGSGLDVELVNESTARISLSGNTAKASALKATLYFYYGPEWNYKVVKKTISVKKVSKQPKVALTVKSGSKLDIVQRDAYCMQYTPKISNTGYVLKDIYVSGADKREFDRQFFLETERDGNGDVRSVAIRLKKDAQVAPATRTYGLEYVLHGSGSDAKQISGSVPVKLKITQSNVTIKNQSKTSLKLSVSGNRPGYVHYMVNTPVFASISDNSVVENFSAQIPPEAFSTSVRVDEYGHLATVAITADPSKVVAGRKYVLNYKVYPEGGAGVKCAKIKVTVSITE